MNEFSFPKIVDVNGSGVRIDYPETGGSLEAKLIDRFDRVSNLRVYNYLGIDDSYEKRRLLRDLCHDKNFNDYNIFVHDDKTGVLVLPEKGSLLFSTPEISDLEEGMLEIKIDGRVPLLHFENFVTPDTSITLRASGSLKEFIILSITGINYSGIGSYDGGAEIENYPGGCFRVYSNIFDFRISDKNKGPIFSLNVQENKINYKLPPDNNFSNFGLNKLKGGLTILLPGLPRMDLSSRLPNSFRISDIDKALCSFHIFDYSIFSFSPTSNFIREIRKLNYFGEDEKGNYIYECFVNGEPFKFIIPS